ncbi:lipoyl domain-containing protein [candidate division WOR-3 bacterium]|nr:lipoyl domain-containing protein [candidate division WOR-3 bacterium]
MPKLGLIMEEGTIAKWYKAEGDSFKEGEALFEVETEKIVNDIEATFAGKLIKILVKEGNTVPVSTTVAEAEEL